MKNELENKIMGKINDGKIRLKSKYVFWAEKLGLGTAFTLSIVLSILFFNLILFYLKETDNLKYLSFGKFGIFAFLESFPYLLVIVFIVLIVFSGYLITKSDASYKKPFGQLIIFMISFIVFFGVVLTYTGLSQKIENHSRNLREPIRMLLPLAEIHDRGVSGIIFEKYDNYLIIQTPQGLRRIEFENNNDLKEGSFVIAVGERKGFNFFASEIKVIERDDVPAIGREIDFKFRSFDRNDFNKRIPSNLLYFEDEEKKCMEDCFRSERSPRDCFDECIRP